MDKRLTSLLELIKKTGDRLVVLDNSSDAEPFVIMDLSSYAQLREERGGGSSPLSVVSDQESMASDMELWEKTKQEIETPVVTEPVSTPELSVTSNETGEIVATESEATVGDKYYFEEIDDNES